MQERLLQCHSCNPEAVVATASLISFAPSMAVLLCRLCSRGRWVPVITSYITLFVSHHSIV